MRKHLLTNEPIPQIKPRAVVQPPPKVTIGGKEVDASGGLVASIDYDTREILVYDKQGRAVAHFPLNELTEEQVQQLTKVFEAPPIIDTATLAERMTTFGRAMKGVRLDDPYHPKHRTRIQPIQYETRPTPRNAPCPCGSGRKFKLCHLGKELPSE
jgi:hypothetical protein